MESNASSPGSASSSAKKRGTKGIQRACVPCSVLKKRCDSGRPCERCIRRGIELDCRDKPTKVEERRQIKRQRVIEAARSGVWGKESSEALLQHMREHPEVTEINSLLHHKEYPHSEQMPESWPPATSNASHSASPEECRTTHTETTVETSIPSVYEHPPSTAPTTSEHSVSTQRSSGECRHVGTPAESMSRS
eukprot:gb/GECG01015303.1/.p1 GENE.gb/GECG01015303.1/~~gb/GECG01015303.1/.p1  ORF type:complete len:193 (+),score=15.42 gb/GECG01015303.1/:1-579(+)